MDDDDDGNCRELPDVNYIQAKSSAFTPPFADTYQTDRPTDRVNTRPINSIRNVRAFPVPDILPAPSRPPPSVPRHSICYSSRSPPSSPRFRCQFFHPLILVLLVVVVGFLYMFFFLRFFFISVTNDNTPVRHKRAHD